MEILRNHGQGLILPGWGKICNWPSRAIPLSRQIWCLNCLCDSHLTRMNTGGGLTTGLSLCFCSGHRERILLAHQNFFWLELWVDSRVYGDCTTSIRRAATRSSVLLRSLFTWAPPAKTAGGYRRPAPCAGALAASG